MHYLTISKPSKTRPKSIEIGSTWPKTREWPMQAIRGSNPRLPYGSVPQNQGEGRLQEPKNDYWKWERLAVLAHTPKHCKSRTKTKISRQSTHWDKNHKDLMSVAWEIMIQSLQTLCTSIVHLPVGKQHRSHYTHPKFTSNISKWRSRDDLSFGTKITTIGCV